MATLSRSAHDEEYTKVAPPPPHPLKGRAIIVTGAASGIGRATALYLASLGVRLALTDSDSEGGRAVCNDVRALGDSVDVVFATMDVADEVAVGKLCRTFLKTYKRLDGLVNCAGIDPPSPPGHEVTMEFWQRSLAVNTTGSFAFCQHFLRDVLNPNNTFTAPVGGYSIVNIGSAASLPDPISSSAQRASKLAVIGFSKAMAREYAQQDIRINVVSPGLVDTQLLNDLLEPTEVSVSEALDNVPMRRVADPLEIAKVIAFLLGPDSSYVTGAVIPVDGGWTA